MTNERGLRKIDLYIILFLLVGSALFRLPKLGYSHFYGDEIKTLYLRKDISASSFLMNQRKGPMQFLTSWFAEKASGGYKESHIRLPYGVIGSLLTPIFYCFSLVFLNRRSAFIAGLFFMLSGFSIAFSRTAQYQVLYLFFGLVGSILASKRLWLLSGISFGLALLSHYDAILLLIPLIFIVDRKSIIKIFITAVVVSMLFYFPNILLGYFDTNTVGYLTKRVAGSGYLPNNSLHTLAVYNPLWIYLASLFVFATLGCLNFYNDKRGKILMLWFLVPFFLFQFLTMNPGTHIHNYLIPTFLLAGLGFDVLATKNKAFMYILGSVNFAIVCAVQAWVYIPMINTGYPWRDTKFIGIPVTRVSGNYHLYLYGFPYYRSWDKIGKYFDSLSGVRNFYTNDNQTVAEYYLGYIPYIAPGIGFRPQYYLYVDNPQELKLKTEIDKNFYDELESEPFIYSIFKMVN